MAVSFVSAENFVVLSLHFFRDTPIRIPWISIVGNRIMA
jgi:hypothetical protein